MNQISFIHVPLPQPQYQQFGIHLWKKMPLWKLWDLAPYAKGPGGVLPTHAQTLVLTVSCEVAPAPLAVVWECLENTVLITLG